MIKNLVNGYGKQAKDNDLFIDRLMENLKEIEIQTGERNLSEITNLRIDVFSYG